MCANTLLFRGSTCRERKANFIVLSWYRLVGVAKTSSETQRRKNRGARKGKWSPRGTENRQASLILEVPQVTGKAGENVNIQVEMGDSSPWPRPSAPGCGDTQGSRK